MTPAAPELPAPDLAAIAARLAAHGLALRGGFNFDATEEAPAKAVLLVGNVGAGYWPHFQAWLAPQPACLSDPLDTWSRTILGEIGEMAGARAVSPSDRPYSPFQQWAMRAEGLKPSPLGILMHPDHGLWHAYRGALLFDRSLAFPRTAAKPHPCDICESKPCLHACPVGAYSADGFAYDACLSYVRNESAGGDAFPHSVALNGDMPSSRLCRTSGCRDRNACPVGTAYRYPAEVQAFHMAAFARL